MKLAVILLMALAVPAHAHEFWINWGGYTDPRAPTVHCCGQNDCQQVPESDMQSTPAGWLIKSLNETVPFPEAYPSEDGKYWRCRRTDGSRRCFFAPGGSS